MNRWFTGKNILTGTCLCACIHVLRVYLRGFIEDPDVSTFILMSQSFWSGDILYESFFDPKLPHILPIYSLSLLSGSVGGHLVVTLFCICATGIVISHSGKNLWGGVIYICLVLLSPGGATGHLAVFANFLIACSYFSLTRYRYIELNTLYENSALCWLITSSVLAGWAIGLRPNYGFALIPLSVWFIWQQKLRVERASIWLAGCFVAIFAPIIVSIQRANISFLDLVELFRSWNRFFYSDDGISGSIRSIVQMYMHPTGPFNLGILVSFLCLALVVSASRKDLAKCTIFTFSLVFLWLSHFISHSYSHYVLMDIMIISLLVSSIQLKARSFLLYITVGILWALLLFSPSNPHSKPDALLIENQRMILSWIANANSSQVVSPTWLTPHWVYRSSVATKGIHPEWSIGLLDRYEFKGLEVAKKFGLDIDWVKQCSTWEDNASIFIGTQELYSKCQFDSFKEINGFSRYPLRVWVKEK